MKRVFLDSLALQPLSHNPDIGKQVLLDSSAAPGLTNFSQAVFSSGQVAQEHAHGDMCDVFFVRRGHASFTVEGEDFAAVAGECVMIEPGERHRIENRGEGDLVLLYFGLKGREHRE